MTRSGSLEVARQTEHWRARFVAMACPCEVLIDDMPESLARAIAEAIAACAWRVEAKFSRYRDDNVVHRINNSGGRPVTVDEEAANLIDFAALLTRVSAGRFDITSGVLRRAWKFDGGDRVPSPREVDQLRELVGWDKVSWERPVLRMQAGMEIDLGGIGKEYAVDAAVRMADELAPGASCLVNFGGDVAVRHERRNGKPWRVGVEACDRAGEPVLLVPLLHGALATSGDSRRFVLKDGKRYSHVLDARTGWPVVDAPRSVTVLADTCTQAGSFSTLAMLEGANAERFLRNEGVRYWLQK